MMLSNYPSQRQYKRLSISYLFFSLFIYFLKITRKSHIYFVLKYNLVY